MVLHTPCPACDVESWRVISYIYSVDGRRIYTVHCASCGGTFHIILVLCDKEDSS